MTPQLKPSEVLLGRLILQIYLIRISFIMCVHFILQSVGLQVLHFVVHELNPVRHELLHIWKALLAC